MDLIGHQLESSPGGFTVQLPDGWGGTAGSCTAPKGSFNRLFLPVQGTTVENICFELRYLNDTRGLAKDHSLLLLCDLSQSNPDAVDVAIVSLKVQRNRYGGDASVSTDSTQFNMIVEKIIKSKEFVPNF